MRSCLLVVAFALVSPVASGQAPPSSDEACRVSTLGTAVLSSRPAPDEALIDDVNWFARPVPNADGRWIVGFASHDQNYLYDLTRGRRVRMPDRSDAVATPDGRYVTVPSHYTLTRTVNFYDTATLIARLDAGRDALDVKPMFAHDDADVADVYYQSVGVVSDTRRGDTTTTVYRMLFSGSFVKPAPGFRVVDYTFTRRGDALTVTPTRSMRLCPQITRDLSTPFVSKDGRYVIAHDGGSEAEPGTLKLFEITGTDPAAQTTSCERRVDFGFAAGKADFSFDGSRVTFHISKHAYLTPFVNGGLNAPAITDVVVTNLVRDGRGRIIGHGGLARVTTSTTEGVGSYFPAFFPDGRLFYIANSAPKNSAGPKRFTFHVVDPDRELFFANVFLDPALRSSAERIGHLWRERCAVSMQPFRPGEAPWAFMSLKPAQCEALVLAAHPGGAPVGLRRACGVLAGGVARGR
jgi:hypothetical protein